MGDGIEPGRIAPAMGEDLIGWAVVRMRALLGVDRRDDALTAELLRGFANEFGAAHRLGVDRDLVGAGQQKRTDVVQRAHPTAHRQRHEADIGGAPHHVEQDGALLMGRRDVEKAKLVGAHLVVQHRLFDRIARVAQAHEIDALDDASVLHVQAGNDADFQHQRILAIAATLNSARAQAASAGTPVVLHKASLSSSRSSTSKSLASFHFCA